MSSIRAAALVMTSALVVACATPERVELPPALVARVDVAPAVPAPVLLRGTPHAEVLDAIDVLAAADASPLYQALARDLALSGRGEAVAAVLAHARARGAEVSRVDAVGALVAGCAVGLGRCDVPLELSFAIPDLGEAVRITRSRGARLDAILTASSRVEGAQAVGWVGVAYDEVRALPTPRARSVWWPRVLEAADAAGADDVGRRAWVTAREDARALDRDLYAPIAWSGLCAWGGFAPERTAPCGRALELGLRGDAAGARRVEVAQELARRGQWDDCVGVSRGLGSGQLDRVEQVAADRGELEPLSRLAMVRSGTPEEAARLRAFARAARAGHVESVRAFLAAAALEVSASEAVDSGDERGEDLDALDVFEVEVASLELEEALSGAPDLARWAALSRRLSRFDHDDRVFLVSLDLIRALSSRDAARAQRELRATLTRLPRRVRTSGAHGVLYDVRDVATLVNGLTRSREDHALVDVVFESVRDPQNVAEACRALSDALVTGVAQVPSPAQARAHMTRCAQARALDARPRARRVDGPGGMLRGEVSLEYYERLLGELARRGAEELAAAHLVGEIEQGGLDARAPLELVDALARRGRHVELMRLARALESSRTSGWSIVWARALELTPDSHLSSALGASDPRAPGPRLSVALARAHLRVGDVARALGVAPDVIDDPDWSDFARGLAVRGASEAARVLARRVRDPESRAALLLEIAR